MKIKGTVGGLKVFQGALGITVNGRPIRLEGRHSDWADDANEIWIEDTERNRQAYKLGRAVTISIQPERASRALRAGGGKAEK